ncbi:MAG: family 43 glycosylhydrolase [Bacteroidaceae bacterium]|nr:family 43 glycosylhydrolase [Paraprevotella sp.]MDY4998616.1 family 43 glycosylhydrolase [Bacteroidaceae bacterium]MDY5192692.1 family 43 glycosylhydrolase [Bacteroidaceae bacterium]MDY5543839.1 family 43 glycosylhydrolase [Bacteroidaceae bacterium]MDY5688406.1 family 43 glycosylhydrolase [Bacteroidaceae bacterium]
MNKKSIVAALGILAWGNLLAQNKYTNPVFDQNTPDPSVVQAPDGAFYAYGTGGTCRKSYDLVNWEDMGIALKRPTWNDSVRTDKEGKVHPMRFSLWALDVSRVGKKYLVHYASAYWGNETRTGLGVAEGTSPTEFTDCGKMFCSTEIGVQNSIDPCYVKDKGKKYLIWGSFRRLYMGRLTKDGKRIKNPSHLTQVAGTAFEGAMVYKRKGYYYLFASVGTCCEGAKSTYHTVVGRSKKLAGPYVDRQGGRMLDNHYETVIKGNDRWKGPGHNSEIITDKEGDTWLLYHAYDALDPEKGRVMLLDKLLWDEEGWPYVEGGTPSTTPQDAPVL